MEYRYIAGSSFGKDSIATILTAIEHGEPLDAVLYCEVMFDENISGEVPEHRHFIYHVAIPWVESHGIPVIKVKSERTYLDVFYQKVRKSSNPLLVGKCNGFPLSGRCYVQSRCKARTLERYAKANLPRDVVKYIGISAEERPRLQRMTSGQVSLLAKYGIEKDRAMKMAKAAGLLSPIYSFARRSGCWFCPNASERELAHLRKWHPELWHKLLELGKENIATKRFNRSYTVFELEERLEQYVMKDNCMM